MTDAMIYIVCATCLLLLVFLIWKEYRRPNRGRLAWRILATTGAVAGMACIALPLHYSARPSSGIVQDAVILTEGFNSDSVSTFLRNRENIPVYTNDAGLLDAKKYNAILLTDLKAVSGLQLHVFGYGLDKAQLASVPSPIIFHPSVIEGFTAIHWSPKINAGEALSVQGSYKNLSRSPKKILLSSYNTTLDSVIVPGNTEHGFLLTAMPRQLGRAVYTVIVTDRNDTLQKEPVPVEIEQGEPVRVLVLASSPDFEHKFVKNWLSEKGYAVLIRTAVSRNRFNKEYLNIPEMNVDRITSPLLDRFDIVLADASELSAISREELATIQSHISQKRTGLIIRADSAATARSFYSASFPLSYADSGRQSVQLSLQDTAHRFPALSVDHLQFIRPQSRSRSLLADQQNRIFAAMSLYGSGKMILTTLPNSYTWMLSGNSDAYHTLWSELFNAIVAEKTASETWRISTSLPKIHEPVTVTLQTQNTAIPQAEIGGISIYMQQDPWLPYQWTGTYWPAKAGWQTGIGLQGQPWYWYAYTKNDWKSVSDARKEQMNKEQGTRNREQEAGKQGTGNREQETKNLLNKLWFFLPFLISVAYLWFENKYYNR